QVVPASAALNSDPARFGWPLAALTALYVAAAALVWWTRPASGWRWAELALIALVGLLLRAVVFGAPPGLSHDAYRYAWDPQLIAHGFSPYAHTPQDPALAFLRDARITPNLRFRDAPTIYPPGAQGLFLITYFLDPRDIYGVKLAMEVCDALTFALTLALLRGRRLDPRRAMLYWWAPIPILEFAFNGHVDAEAIMWTVAALLASVGTWRGARVATGVLIGLAALTKFYPILFVIPLIRRRDYGLLAGLVGVTALGYAPFVALGLGGGGYLETYLGQRFVDQGPLLGAINWLVAPLTQAPAILIGSNLLALAALAGLIALYRWRVGLSAEAGMLALSAAWIALSPHLFPWYIAALAPLLALFPGSPLSPLSPAPRGRGGQGLRSAPGAAIVALWVFMLLMPFTYALFAPGGDAGLFIWFSLIPAAITVAPLATRRGRAAWLAVWRRLVAPVTRAELRAVRDAWLTAGG
ncbi:MAG TPA: glycosyltransferase 87 family protein, partial [Ktedonobacterales bacterium]